MKVYIPQRRQMMWTHRAQTGSTKANTRRISHFNAKPIVDPHASFRLGQTLLKLETEGM